MYVCMYVYICMYVCIFVYIYVCMYVCMYGNRDRRFPWKLRSGRAVELVRVALRTCSKPISSPQFWLWIAPPSRSCSRSLSLSRSLSFSVSLCGSLSLSLSLSLICSFGVWVSLLCRFPFGVFHETVDGVFQNYCFNPSVISVCFQ
jgi:hypothetical protein